MTTVIRPLEDKTAIEAEEEQDTGVAPYAWTVEQFYRAIRLGVFDHPERLELMEGETITKLSPQEIPHVQAVLYTEQEMRRIFEPACHVRTQSPLNISGQTEPEPDVMVVRGAPRDYNNRKPTPSEVRLIVPGKRSAAPPGSEGGSRVAAVRAEDPSILHRPKGIILWIVAE